MLHRTRQAAEGKASARSLLLLLKQVILLALYIGLQYNSPIDAYKDLLQLLMQVQHRLFDSDTPALNSQFEQAVGKEGWL